MGRENRPPTREGRVIVAAAGDRWTAQLDLDERVGDPSSRVRVDVPGTFLSQAAAAHAAKGVLNEWRAGRVTLREIVLRELAAAYRHLREKHKPMEPVAVPTTTVAWERALGLWELAAWLDPADAARYRDHARRAFEVTATVKHHRLRDVESEPAQ